MSCSVCGNYNDIDYVTFKHLKINNEKTKLEFNNFFYTY